MSSGERELQTRAREQHHEVGPAEGASRGGNPLKCHTETAEKRRKTLAQQRVSQRINALRSTVNNGPAALGGSGREIGCPTQKPSRAAKVGLCGALHAGVESAPEGTRPTS